MSAMEIGCLPDSILLEVFKHLLQFRDVCICARVCRRWWRIARDRVLQRIINATSRPLPAPQVWSLIETHTSRYLVELRISGPVPMLTNVWRVIASEFFSHLAQTCPSLQVLHITYASLKPSLTTKSAVVPTLPLTLVELSLRGSLFHPGDVLQPALPHLRVLDLSFCTQVSSYELRDLDQWPNLRALSLEGCHSVNRMGISSILHLMARLVVLDIEGTDVREEGLSLVLCHGVNLRYLFAGHTEATGKAFSKALPHIRTRLESSEGLTHICLRRTWMKKDCLPNLLEAAPRLMWLAVTSRHMSADVKARLEQSVPKSCKFLQCASYGGGVTSCSHFTSGFVKNVKW